MLTLPSIAMSDPSPAKVQQPVQLEVFCAPIVFSVGSTGGGAVSFDGFFDEFSDEMVFLRKTEKRNNECQETTQKFPGMFVRKYLH